MGEVHMDKGRVGEDRGSKETDRYLLTVTFTIQFLMANKLTANGFVSGR
jgi:hypothetical protein